MREKFLAIAEDRGFFRPLFKAVLEPVAFKGFLERSDINYIVQQLSHRRLEYAGAAGVLLPCFTTSARLDTSTSVLHMLDTVPAAVRTVNERLENLRVCAVQVCTALRFVVGFM